MRAVWKITVIAAAATAVVFLFAILMRQTGRRNVVGVVLVSDPDLAKQHAISNVKVETPGNVPVLTDAAGLFRISLDGSSLLKGVITQRVLPNGISVTLQHPGYAPVEETLLLDGKLYVLHMKAVETKTSTTVPEVPISDVRVRYTESAETSVDTGSELRNFDVVNKGNVPCNGASPCSPDGRWKATIGGATLDAGEGNEFREARVSCIAGPCPFTRIEKDNFSRPARVISVSMRDWSDTTSFLLEAEVTRTSLSDRVQLSYPIVYGRGMNFSLPPSGEGPSIEASVAGREIVFPLGPELNLAWASCTVQVAKDQTKSYRCDLKPGYRFK